MRKRRSFYVQWHLLDRCNLRCRHCYQDNFSSEPELSWPELKFLADNLISTMRIWQAKLEVALTGGEPFLKKELKLLLETLNSSSEVKAISLITNGLLIPDWVEELKKFKKFKELRISLDGVRPETNDDLRGQGTYKQVLKGMRKVKEMGLPFLIMFTVMKKNFHEVPWLFELAKTVGASGFIIERFFPLGQGKNWVNEVLGAEDFFFLWEQILDRSNLAARPKELIPFRAIKIELDQPFPRVFGSGCIIGQDGLALMPDGTIFPCRRFPLPLGNLMEKPLSEIWQNSKILQTLRDKSKLKGHCSNCQVKTCFGCRAMSYVLTGDPFAPDPHCWLMS
ncbi:MAG: radical SAM protein [Candidatus Aminicenantes bacterium]|nr:radical SAM protein [Candidatus Aminicenantes bacterium]